MEPVSPVSSPSLAHDKGLPKHLEELDRSHLEGDLRHKQPGRALPPRPLLPTALGGGIVVTTSPEKNPGYEEVEESEGRAGIREQHSARHMPHLPPTH